MLREQSLRMGRLGAWGLTLVLLAPVVLATPGTLKVAICDPAYAPFITKSESGTYDGFEIDQWEKMYTYMIQEAEESGNQTLIDMVGDESPEFIPMPADEIEKQIVSGDLDFTLCGWYQTADRINTWNFLPSYHSSGMRALVKKIPPNLDEWSIMKVAMGEPDEYATFALLVVVLISILYAHLIWIIERRDNHMISMEYGPGVFDGFYLGLMVASTITFGNPRPITYAGSVLTWIWAFVGAFFMAVFVAAITSNILENKLGVPPSIINIQRPADMNGYKVGTSFPIATEAVRTAAPGAIIQEFATQRGAMDALVAEEVDIYVDDSWTLQYVANRVEDLADQVLPVGLTFHKLEVAIAIHSPKGERHPVHSIASQAMVNYLRGDGRRDHQVNQLHWFAEEIVDAGVTDIKVLEKELGDLNNKILIILACLLCLWVGSVLFHYRNQIKTARRKVGLKNALDLPPTFSKADLRHKSAILFHSFASGNLGVSEFGRSFSASSKLNPSNLNNGLTLSVTEIQSKLAQLGIEISLKDISKVCEDGAQSSLVKTSSYDEEGGGKSLVKEISTGLSAMRRKSTRVALDPINDTQFAKLVEYIILQDAVDNNKDQFQPALFTHVDEGTEEIKDLIQAYLVATKKEYNKALSEIKERYARDLQELSAYRSQCTCGCVPIPETPIATKQFNNDTCVAIAEESDSALRFPNPETYGNDFRTSSLSGSSANHRSDNLDDLRNDDVREVVLAHSLLFEEDK